MQDSNTSKTKTRKLQVNMWDMTQTKRLKEERHVKKILAW